MGNGGATSRSSVSPACLYGRPAGRRGCPPPSGWSYGSLLPADGDDDNEDDNDDDDDDDDDGDDNNYDDKDDEDGNDDDDDDDDGDNDAEDDDEDYDNDDEDGNDDDDALPAGLSHGRPAIGRLAPCNVERW